MDLCRSGNLKSTYNNINNNENTKSNDIINFMENLFKILINHYSSITTTSLINANYNNNEEKTTDNISIVEKPIIYT